MSSIWCVYTTNTVYILHNTIMLVYVVVVMKYLFLATADSFTLQMENKEQYKDTAAFKLLSETDGIVRGLV